MSTKPIVDALLPLAAPIAAAVLALFLEGARTRITAAAIAVVVAAGLWTYTAPHRATKRYFNAYEHFHYALPTRYADELGYTGLYDAAVAAALEIPGAPTPPPKVRDLATAHLVPASVIVERSAATRARFSPERWEAFRADVAWLLPRMGASTWRQALGDKGYNASPVYGAIAGFFTSRVDVPHGGLLWLPFLDVAILAFTLLVVWRVFGGRAAALVLAMLVTHALTSHSHQKAALLRLDWICALVLSLAALQRRSFFLAGGLTAYAAAVRLFPAVFGFAMAVKLIDGLVRERRPPREAVRFLAGGAVATAALVAPTLAGGGLARWSEFFEKILAHNGQLTGWRVGLKYLFLGTWDGRGWGGAAPLAAAQHLAPLWWVVVVAALVALALVVRRLDFVEAHAMGFCVAFVLVAPTYYYWILVLVPTLAFAARLDQARRRIGLSLLFWSGAVGVVLLASLDRGWLTFYGASAALFVVVAWWVASAWRAP